MPETTRFMEASLSNEPHCLAASILVAAIMP
jgi:hypothetical protein